MHITLYTVAMSDVYEYATCEDTNAALKRPLNMLATQITVVAIIPEALCILCYTRGVPILIGGSPFHYIRTNIIRRMYTGIFDFL